MKAQQQIIGGRYQYNPLNPLKQTQIYTQYKAYDRSTKRDLIMHLMNRDDRLVQVLRDIKHPFVTLVFDVVMLDDGNVAFLYQNGGITTLTEVMDNNGFLMQQDALVILKMLLLALKELHQKMIIFGRLCTDNIILWQSSMIKLGYNAYEEQVPLAFQSPQMLQGKKISKASDIYTLGVILYRMIYGVLPFSGQHEKQVLKHIKGKDYNTSYQQGHSPFKMVFSKEITYLIQSMLDYYQQNRPKIQQILANTYMNFQVETDHQSYIKPKVNLLPQPFIKKYLVYRASKMTIKYDHYYQQQCYMALCTTSKKMVRIYAPQIRMFEADPRKIDSYFQKLKAIQQNYTEQCEFLVKLEDIDKFRQQPVFVTEYCNQGDLMSYLEKRKLSEGWLSQKEINMLMYIMALAIKQMRELGVSSIHTLHSQRIMIKDKGIKLRQPGMLSPAVQKKLIESKNIIDYFAPQLKENLEMVQLDKSDMWSYGVLYYYLLSIKLPVSDEQGLIDIQSLKTNQKNRNIIGKCLDYNVQTRLELQNIKLENFDEDLLQLMLKQQKEHQQALKELQHVQSEDEIEEELMKDKKVMFKNRKRPLFKDYNKIIAQSSTSNCRICIKAFFGVMTFFIVFFGNFLINGGYGLIRSNYFNPITLQVPYNYGTSLINMTILTVDGANIQDNYAQYSYQQFTKVLRCVTNTYKSDSSGLVSDFINGTNTIFCLFGYIWVILFIILYILYQAKLDLPSILFERKQKKQNKNLYHFITFLPIIPAILFCFFYTFAIQYVMQINPCFGIESLAYPKFTSIQALLKGDTTTFFQYVFLTVILWSILMFLYGYLTLITKKFNLRVYEWKMIIPTIVIMLTYTVICRVGFGSASILQPSWTYKINMDLAWQTYKGFFGFFPQALFAVVFVFDRIVDLIFWYFLKRGLEGPGDEDIKQVKIVQARYQPTEQRQLENEKSNIYMIEHDFQRFD